jgi:hypothetical protein
MTPPSAKPAEVQISTSEYKIRPLKKAARELLGYPHPHRVSRGLYVEQAIGISTDEFTRAKDSGVQYLRNVFPLSELDWDRARCAEYLAERGFAGTVKSAGGVGLANSTIQVRIVGVRSFYDFLVEEGIRKRKPVRRGQSSRRGARPKQGLVRGWARHPGSQRTRVGSDPAGVRARVGAQSADGDLRLRRRAAP